MSHQQYSIPAPTIHNTPIFSSHLVIPAFHCHQPESIVQSSSCYKEKRTDILFPHPPHTLTITKSDIHSKVGSNVMVPLSSSASKSPWKRHLKVQYWFIIPSETCQSSWLQGLATTEMLQLARARHIRRGKRNVKYRQQLSTPLVAWGMFHLSFNRMTPHYGYLGVWLPFARPSFAVQICIYQSRGHKWQ